MSGSEETTKKEAVTKKYCCLCNDNESNLMIQCSDCRNWVHYRCSQLPAYQILVFTKKNRKYTCKNCFPLEKAEHEDLILVCSDGKLNELHQQTEHQKNIIRSLEDKLKDQYEAEVKKVNFYKAEIVKYQSAKEDLHNDTGKIQKEIEIKDREIKNLQKQIKKNTEEKKSFIENLEKVNISHESKKNELEKKCTEVMQLQDIIQKLELEAVVRNQTDSKNENTETIFQEIKSNESNCRFFPSESGCRFKEKCKFQHVNICIFYAKYGKCKYGEHCRNWHTKNILCRFNEAKKPCKFGKKCRYVHIHTHNGPETPSNIAKQTNGSSANRFMDNTQINTNTRDIEEHITTVIDTKIHFLGERLLREMRRMATVEIQKNQSQNDHSTNNQSINQNFPYHHKIAQPQNQEVLRPVQNLNFQPQNIPKHQNQQFIRPIYPVCPPTNLQMTLPN